MGCIVFWDLYGLVLFDKLLGLSFNQVLQVVCWLFWVVKGGYIGVFDLLVMGLLLLCFGEVMKLVGYLLGLCKVYVVICQLGVIMIIGDWEGEVVIWWIVLVLDVVCIEVVLVLLCGCIWQVLLVYLVIKQGGELLYLKVCCGEVVEVFVCEVEIYWFEFIRWVGDELQLEVECGLGIYICSLVVDLGEVLGCGVYLVLLWCLWVELFCDLVMVILVQVEVVVVEGDEVLLVLMCLVVEGLVYLLVVYLDLIQSQVVVQGWCVVVEFVQMFVGLCVVFVVDGVLLVLGECDVQGQVCVVWGFNLLLLVQVL